MSTAKCPRCYHPVPGHYSWCSTGRIATILKRLF